jgi:transcription antitermination factor NusG
LLVRFFIIPRWDWEGGAVAIWQTEDTTSPGKAVSAQVNVAELNWYAIQTRARHEKKVDSQLHERGVESFLPLTDEIHQWSDRRKVVRQPLFTGYLFVHIPDTLDARNSVLSTLGACWFVGNSGMGLPIPDKQIQDVETILSCPVGATAFPFVRVGQRVRIRGGCLDGVEGILVAKNDDPRIVVSVDLVRRSVAVQLDGYDVEEV